MSSLVYEEALAYLYDLQKYGIKFGLSSTRNLLQRLGNPQEQLKAIHIGGTNGKGSAAAMISAVLVGAGYRVGLYTSPHLVRFNERFRINEQDVEDGRILEVYQWVRDVVNKSEPPTFFEMTTAMALALFATEKVDWDSIESISGEIAIISSSINCPFSSILIYFKKEYLCSSVLIIDPITVAAKLFVVLLPATA